MQQYESQTFHAVEKAGTNYERILFTGRLIQVATWIAQHYTPAQQAEHMIYIRNPATTCYLGKDAAERLKDPSAKYSRGSHSVG
jgi:hypothetical protein